MFTISILTYTALEAAKRCIDAVLCSEVEFNIILTSNGNPEVEKYFKAMAQKDTRFRVVVNEKNLGFIEPNRKALEMTETPFFVMLNDDAIVPRNWLTLLHAEFLKFPTAALAGPQGGCTALSPSFHGHPGTLEYLEGACLMARTDLVKKHGLFDKELQFAYAEDSCLSLRMRELGYSLHQAKFSLISHQRGTTSRHIKEVSKFQELNHAYARKRFAHYLKVRKFDHPIILRRTGAYGDVLLVTPVIRALRQQRPLSPIYVETICPEVFNNNPLVTKAAHHLPHHHSAEVINLDGSYEACPDKHFVKTYAERCRVELDSTRTELYPSEADHAWAERAIPEGKWIAFHCGPSTWPNKEWTFDRFAVVIAAMKADGYNSVLIGTKSQQKEPEADLDMRGRTTIHQLGALLKRCALYIGLDSFPLHAAQAMGTPVIGLFGVTLPGPILTDGSVAIGVCADPQHPAAGMRHKVTGRVSVVTASNPMLTITSEQVIEAARKLLAPNIFE